jgi:hypothetical protein
MGLRDTIKFLTEPADSDDFDKSREEWQAAKDAKKQAAKDAKRDGNRHDQ